MRDIHFHFGRAAVVMALVFLSFLSSFCQAQEHLFSDSPTTELQQMQLPDDQATLDAQSHARQTMQQLDEMEENSHISIPDLPEIGSLPQSEIPAEDISVIAERFKDIGRMQVERARSHDLLVLVSLSMPDGALQKLAEQAEKAGATLVFRGLKENSMAKMGKAIRKVLEGRNVPVAIHPPAFQQFSVTHVPAFVLASQEAGKVLDNGCARPQTFVKVSGDVTLDYALDYIERHSTDWATIAKSFRSRIDRVIQ